MLARVDLAGSGYAIIETLVEDSGTVLCRARRRASDETVLIKTAAASRHGTRASEPLQREYSLAKQVTGGPLLRPIALEATEGHKILVLEDYGGEPLHRRGAPASMRAFVDLAVRLAGALERLHADGLVCNNLKPHNVLEHPATGELKLHGLELASLLPSQRGTVTGPWITESFLPYMSPEQTGRTSHAIDQRTDLYSLGVTLYELRSGTLPYSADDPLGWIHAHLARKPLPLDAVVPETPNMLARIIEKLMAKEPGDRYQSARGLRHDLERCRRSLTREGAIPSFSLAEHDWNERFRTPDRLYGRRVEVETLERLYSGVAESGTPRLVVVTGYSGIGKTAVVQQLSGPVTQKEGLFYIGKCDLLRKGIPYSPIAQAIGALVLDIMTESDDQVALWRTEIQNAIGTQGQLLIDVIPEIERLIGKQPPLGLLPLDDTERLFHQTFRRFLHVFARQEHPLALFVDDLQWIDSASLVLIERILEDPSTSHLLFLGAYRENEVHAAHPVSTTLASLEEGGAEITRLRVGPLSRSELAQFVAETLRRPREAVDDLSRLVHEKTGGNPFFATQFLTSLYHDGLVYFDSEAERWSWNVDSIRTRALSDNVVDLVVKRLKRLPADTRRALELAACVGNTFDAKTLAAVSERSEAEMHADLWDALGAGVIIRSGPVYVFAHDRVHHAVHGFIGETERQRIHLAIGLFLLRGTRQDQLGEKVFDIVDQLNRGASLVDTPDIRRQVAELDLLASRRAKGSAAHTAAASYATAGMKMLAPTSWHDAYALALGLHLEAAHAAYLSRDFERAKAILSDLLPRTKTKTDQAAAFSILVQLHTAEGNAEEACALTLGYLRDFGIDLPSHPARQEVRRRYEQMLEQLGERPIETLTSLPEMRDPERVALMRLLTLASSAAVLVDVNLWALLSHQRVRLSLEFGNTDASAHAYSTFALALGSLFGDLADAARFGRLSLAMVDDHGASPFCAPVYLNAGVYLGYWVRPLDEVIDILHQTIRVGTETGVLTYVCYAASDLAAARLIRGDTLDDVKQEAEVQYAVVTRNRFRQIAHTLEISLLFVQRLQGHGAWDAETIRRSVTTKSYSFNVFCFYTRRLQADVIFGDFEAALESAKAADALSETTPPFLLWVADWAFYRAIALGRAGKIDALQRAREQFDIWSASCPANFLDRAQFIEAERARAEHRNLDALRLYDQAIQSARQAGFVHHEALFSELAAEFCGEQRLDGIKAKYLREARAAYLRWGATAKVEQLARGGQSLVSARAPAARAAFAAGVEEIDLLSVMKASQMVSGELVLDELVPTLMRVVMEHAGAQRGRLILPRSGRLEVTAAAESDEHGVHAHSPGVPIEGSDLVPESIIQYAARSRRYVILDDAATEMGRFASDAYVARHKPRSVLCLPIFRGADAVGYLYLENSLIAGAFTRDNLLIVESLASQAAISLENARLYNDLRASESKLAHFFEGLPVGVFVLDTSGQPVLANKKASEILGRDIDLKVPVSELARAYSLYTARTGTPYPIASSPFGKALRGESSMMDDAEVRLGDRAVPLAIWGTPIKDPEGSVRYAIIAFQDITSQRHAELQRSRLEEQLQRAERLESIGRLAGGVAHDFNNLLVPMLVGSEMVLRSMEENDPRRDQIKQIQEAAERAAELVRQLLAVGRKQVLEPRELDLRSEVEALVPMLRRVVREDIDIRLEGATGNSRVRADRSQIQRVVTNLVMNGADAMPNGGVLTLGVRDVTVNGTRSAFASPGRYVVLRVSDSGTGILPEALPKIFEPFFTTKPPGHGTGLGLPTVYGLVKQHGGYVDVRSEVGVGTAFEVYLPRIDERRPASQATPKPLANAKSHARTTILVVDDDDSVRRVLEEVLRREDYRVTTTASATEALRLAAQLGERLDLLITDVVMPGMNGRALFERLAPAHPNLRALFISGYSDQVVSAHRVLEADVNFLQKPFSVDALKRKVEEVLADDSS